MTDTDLFTAGSADSGELPNTVTATNSASSEQAGAPAAAPAADEAPAATRARRGALTSLVLPELRAMAKEIGVEGASGMRKSELIAAIRERRGEANGKPAAKSDIAEATAAAPAGDTAADSTAPEQAAEAQPQQRRRERRGSSREQGGPNAGEQAGDQDKTEAGRPESGQAEGRGKNAPQEQQGGGRETREHKDNQGGQTSKAEGRADSDTRSDGGDQQGGQNRGRGGEGGGNRAADNDDDGDGRQGRRGRRFRDRRRRERGGEGGGGGDRDTELREDDVVQPVAGILDVLDNYAFVRTSGYLAGPNDVYVSMNMVRKNGLRRGDAVTGAVRVPKDGEQSNQRQKFNPLVRLDSVNGGPVEEARKRPEFQKLTPLYPNTRLRLETSSDKLTTRVIDLIMPIGKGQRALIVSPPKAGKTTIMQDIANAITRNNPECHLMVVLVDERPEEVTDMQRSVKGEVIASTFDRPPSDHTQAAELAIERAKRLVEQGKDVVVLLDSITRLGRAYNNASPASGRILSGGVDSTALYPPKRFLGAARNIEEGGSLTIIATAMVETGSTGDTVIFEEFKGTGNAELKLDRKIAERRVFPAVDVNPSGTRKDELLLSPDEFAVVHKLRRVLSGLDPHQAIDLLMSQLRKTKNNYEFLVQVSKNTPGGVDND
ncbi:transcription termination factor Rho [Mycolicibacterium austroafricanum]|uniref:Transcription termination factor Rho n=1 Tax=Mycolicibacterium austroafricanum TaxID=39687 RepID=A0ABT8HLW1_MYCAO|nr:MULTISPECIES: transcription termination factor Rho [Mycolicibacterium]MDN4521540.1 transcription termination factor Rho [Mycolicibacterium austroafricanum]MDW5610671.1 transcription termination factor Rho [Mycolicibacterium sp. D5.8-2]PQP46382.1 transcription termination factor Rho [Mycolicibacterium austroafricanum]QRZ05450.1 transcription termination factor Rho [Mycolicibacterium austroafricanum]QZT67012.1 transcription termination factor Rho [Mycolicibacterium austroafricanum]